MKRVAIGLAALVALPLQGCIQDWRGDVTVCPVHHQHMSWETKPIAYGLLSPQSFDRLRQEQEAREREFPYANTWIHGGCCGSLWEFAMVRYCTECRKAEAKWNAEHPVEKKPEPAVTTESPRDSEISARPVK